MCLRTDTIIILFTSLAVSAGHHIASIVPAGIASCSDLGYKNICNLEKNYFNFHKNAFNL
jgi:hypothetical protein